jgi:large subunit ribosomal protein L21
MYAIIKTGGKQYKVTEGQKLKVEKLSLDVNSEVTFEEVLFVFDGNDVKVGKPVVEGAKVTGTVVDNGKHKKVINFQYKPKTGYRKTRGHRQPYTEVEIKKIDA